MAGRHKVIAIIKYLSGQHRASLFIRNALFDPLLIQLLLNRVEEITCQKRFVLTLKDLAFVADLSDVKPVPQQLDKSAWLKPICRKLPPTLGGPFLRLDPQFL